MKSFREFMFKASLNMRRSSSFFHLQSAYRNIKQFNIEIPT